MTLTGFNQEGGRVTGNIEKLVVEKVSEGFKLYNEEGQ